MTLFLISSTPIQELRADPIHLKDWVERLPSQASRSLSTHFDFKNQHLKASVIDELLAKKIFNELAQLPYIPYRYLADGCYARAHALSLELEKRGVISLKIFLKGNLKIKSVSQPSGYIRWTYHVAPVILVRKEDGTVEPRIFDPTLITHPARLQEWLSIQGVLFDADYYFETRFAYNPDEHDISEWDPLDLEDTEDMLLQHALQLQNSR